MKRAIISIIDVPEDMLGNLELSGEVVIDSDIDEIMTFNSAPTKSEQLEFRKIAAMAKIFAQVIRDNSPACARQTIALQHVVDARMSASAAIATYGADFSGEII